MNQSQQQTCHHTQSGDGHCLHDIDVFHLHARRADIAQQDFVEENCAESVR